MGKTCNVLYEEWPCNTRSPAVTRIADHTGCQCLQGRPRSVIFMSFESQYMPLPINDQ